MQNIQAGDLRHRIKIQYNAKAGQTDDNDNPIYDWQPITINTIWAKKAGLKGKLFYQAAATNSENNVMFTIRYRSDVKAGMQLIDGNDIYDIYIKPIDPDDKRMWLQLHCKEILQNGG